MGPRKSDPPLMAQCVAKMRWGTGFYATPSGSVRIGLAFGSGGNTQTAGVTPGYFISPLQGEKGRL
jgi:hypothetical protein